MKNKYYAFLIFIFGFLYQNQSFSQNLGVCGTETSDTSYSAERISNCSNTGTDWLTYRTPGHWIPNSSTPVKTILINYIICQDDNGDNAWKDSPAFRAQVALMFDSINARYSNSKPKNYSLTCEPTINYITDTKIRFELNEIIFLENTTFNNSCTSSQGNVINQYVYDNYPSSRKAMNHIFTMPDVTPPDPACPYWGFYYPSSDKSFVLTQYSMYDNNYYVVWQDHVHHIAHEYGHAVGLHHVYDSEYTPISHYDFLDDVFGTCAHTSVCAPSTTTVCYLPQSFFSNITRAPLMSGVNNSYYISPKSAGRMHRALSLYNSSFLINNCSMEKFVKEKTSYTMPYEITSNQTWDFAIKMYQDIVVKSGNTLTIKCDVRMPDDSKIIVERGAKLIIDGGLVTNTGSLWNGIEVWGTSNQPQSNLTSTGQGQVIIINGGIIENAHDGITTCKKINGDPQWDYTGGIVQCGGAGSTNTAVFRNNRRAVEFLSYHNITNSIESNNISFFNRTTFEVTGPLLDPNVVLIPQVSMYDVKGVGFGVDSYFESTTSLSEDDRGTGIFSIDATYAIEDVHFNNLYYGINAESSTSNHYINVQNCFFNNNSRGIYTLATGGDNIFENTFERIPQGTLLGGAYGIYMDGSKNFEIRENVFNSLSGAPSNLDNFGVIVNNCGSYTNNIYDNTFYNVYAGVQTQGAMDPPAAMDF